MCAAADAFPVVEDPSDHEREKHVTLFIHGYNTTWQEAVRRYRQICSALYSGRSSLGLCVLFTWPSDGLKIGYYPDRLDARRSADELAHVLSALYQHVLQTQTHEMETGQPHCRAKISIIAHSMGNYLVQKTRMGPDSCRKGRWRNLLLTKQIGAWSADGGVRHGEH